MARISEEELIVPALKVMNTSAVSGTFTIADSGKAYLIEK